MKKSFLCPQKDTRIWWRGKKRKRKESHQEWEKFQVATTRKGYSIARLILKTFTKKCAPLLPYLESTFKAVCFDLFSTNMGTSVIKAGVSEGSRLSYFYWFRCHYLLINNYLPYIALKETVHFRTYMLWLWLRLVQVAFFAQLWTYVVLL